MSNREILRKAHSFLADAMRTLESLDSGSASDQNIASLKNLKAAFREFEDSCCKGLVTPHSGR